MEIKFLDHVQLAMPPGGEAAARAFYRDLLDIPEAPKPPHLAARGGCWFERGCLKIHLGVEDDFRPARKAHPALVVDQLAELVSRLEAAGYPTSGIDGFSERTSAYVNDPFGNRIELLEFNRPE
jgi:catechol 2,3-dioxygenase-like lactoylglutathione lyase family enzyme